MVRRSTINRSPQPYVYGADFTAGDLAEGGRARDRSLGWRGVGGRWLVWVSRAVIRLVPLVIGYRDVIAIGLGETTTSRPPPTSATVASTRRNASPQFGSSG
jgi:hypothetical protein